MTNIDETAIIGGPPQHFKGVKDILHPVLIGNDVKIGPFTTVDKGTQRPTIVGNGTYIMGHCNIGHDTQIGQNCQIADSVVVAGHCTVGNNVRIGIGAMITPFTTIGDGARIGAGSIVVKDVPANECWAGNPAKKLYSFCPQCGEKQETTTLCGDCVWENAIKESESYRELMEEV